MTEDTRRGFMQKLATLLSAGSSVPVAELEAVTGQEEKFEYFWLPNTSETTGEITQKVGDTVQKKERTSKKIELSRLRYDHEEDELHFLVGDDWITPEHEGYNQGPLPCMHAPVNKLDVKDPSALFAAVESLSPSEEISPNNMDKESLQRMTEMADNKEVDFKGVYRSLEETKGPVDGSDIDRPSNTENYESPFEFFNTFLIHSKGDARDYSEWGERDKKFTRAKEVHPDDEYPFTEAMKAKTRSQNEELIENADDGNVSIQRVPDFEALDEEYDEIFASDGVYIGDNIKIYAEKEKDLGIANVEADTSFEHADSFGLGAAKDFVADIHKESYSGSLSADEKALVMLARASDKEEPTYIASYRM